MTKGSASSLEKDEVMDIVFWFRVFFGLSFGLVCGVLKLTGYPVLISYFVLLLSLTSVYLNRFIEIDEDDFNPQEMFMEGFANALGLFMLSWTLIYTYL